VSYNYSEKKTGAKRALLRLLGKGIFHSFFLRWGAGHDKMKKGEKGERTRLILGPGKNV